MTQATDILMPYNPELPDNYYQTPKPGNLHGPTGRFQFGPSSEGAVNYCLQIQMFDGAPNKFFCRPATWDETVRFIDAREAAIRDAFFWRNIAHNRKVTRAMVAFVAVVEFMLLLGVHHG